MGELVVGAGTGAGGRDEQGMTHVSRYADAAEPVRLADIAAAAGVSVPTVSKVLHGHSDVAAQTRSRVAALLADHNYAVRRRAIRPCLIDLVLADLSPWSVEIIRGAEEVASDEDCRVIVSVVPGGSDTVPWLTRLSASQSDGIILVPTDLSPADRARLAALSVPLVIVDPVGSPIPASRRSARPTGPEALPRPSTWPRSVTAGSRSSPAACRCCAAGRGWTGTGRRWSVRGYPPIPP